MNMDKPSLIWVNVLHIYQPPHQTKEVVSQVASESYQLILALLNHYPRLKITLNISGSLIELLQTNGFNYIISGIKEYSAAGRIELLGSAMYHPILPLIPQTELIRQIEYNTILLRQTFGTSFSHAGFYLPEMAYNNAVGTAIKAAGFSWIVLDQMHAQEPVDPGTRYTIEENGLGVIFRDRKVSRMFPPEFVETHFDQLTSPYLVTAHDGSWHGYLTRGEWKQL